MYEFQIFKFDNDMNSYRNLLINLYYTRKRNVF